MSYQIRMGVPEMEDFWNSLSKKAETNSLKGSEKDLFKRLLKALRFLENNPRHPGLKSHEISTLSKRYGMKVWQSYLDNKTPSAGRLYWVYGPAKNDITEIGIEPHPEDKKHGYEKVKLSDAN